MLHVLHPWNASIRLADERRAKQLGRARLGASAWPTHTWYLHTPGTCGLHTPGTCPPTHTWYLSTRPSVSRMTIRAGGATLPAAACTSAAAFSAAAAWAPAAPAAAALGPGAACGGPDFAVALPIRLPAMLMAASMLVPPLMRVCTRSAGGDGGETLLRASVVRTASTP